MREFVPPAQWVHLKEARIERKSAIAIDDGLVEAAQLVQQRGPNNSLRTHQKRNAIDRSTDCNRLERSTGNLR